MFDKVNLFEIPTLTSWGFRRICPYFPRSCTYLFSINNVIKCFGILIIVLRECWFSPDFMHLYNSIFKKTGN
jgi:hypothetical protein